MKVMSLDPALGGGCAILCAHLGDKLTILDGRVDYGLQKTEEIFEMIEHFAAEYAPSLLIVEYDAQQKGIGNDDRLALLGRRYGFHVRPHLTRGNKMDAIFGVASMDQSFKRAEIRIPYGDTYTQEKMGPLVDQLKAWRPDIPTAQLTQDLVMALWFLWKHWMEIKKVHKEPAAPAWRPSWLIQERRGA